MEHSDIVYISTTDHVNSLLHALQGVVETDLNLKTQLQQHPKTEEQKKGKQSDPMQNKMVLLGQGKAENQLNKSESVYKEFGLCLCPNCELVKHTER